MTGIEEFYFKIYTSIERNKLISSIRQGCVIMIPVFIIGAFSLLFQNFPIPVVKEFMLSFAGGIIFRFFGFIYEATFGFAAIYLLAAITYKYSLQITEKFTSINFIAIIVSIVSYVIFSGAKDLMGVDGIEVKAMLLNYTDVRNIFSSMLVALISTTIFLKSYYIVAKKSKEIYADTEVRNTMNAIGPMIITVSVFSVIAVIIDKFTPYSGFNQLIIAGINAPFKSMGRNIFSAALDIFMQSLLWFFGIHGGNTFEAVNGTVFTNVSGEILTKSFFDVFVLMGGCGTAICLLIGLILFSKDKYDKKLVHRAAIPMLFNINEIMIFGLPIVINPVFVVPFICTPVIVLLISYFAVSIGLVPMPVNSICWTDPVLISGYKATGSITGTLLQLFNVIVGVLIYLPFIRINDKMRKIQFQTMVDTMTSMIKEAEKDNSTCEFAKMPNVISKVAQELTNKLISDIENNKINIYYQPQVNREEKVASAEALLRWSAGLEYNIYPPLVISIAKEYNCYDNLTRCIVEKVLEDINILGNQHDISIPISINIETGQLIDIEFINWIIDAKNRNNIPDNILQLEITEHTELLESKELNNIFELLHENHIKIAIDDFSMGATSLNYLQGNNFDYVKLDGGIVRNVLLNERTKEIIDSIISLGKTLDYEVVAEYVEDREQKEALKEMGCNLYQGYLYSPAIPIENFAEYVKHINN